MDFQLNEEQKLIQQTARDFAQNEVAKDAAERDQTETFPAAHVKQMAELGFMGMMVSPEYDGGGLDTVSYVVIEGTIITEHNFTDLHIIIFTLFFKIHFSGYPSIVVLVYLREGNKFLFQNKIK